MPHRSPLFRFALAAVAAASTCPLTASAQTSVKHVYTVNERTNDISIFSIDPATGSLAAAGTVATPPLPHWIQFSPSGAFAYVVADDGTNASLTTYTVDAGSGTLRLINSAPLAPGTFPTLKISPTGTSLVLADGRNDLLSLYSLNASSGIPTQTASLASPNIPWSVAFSPTSPFLFTIGNAHSLQAFSLDAAVGKLTSLLSLRSGSPVEVLEKTPTVQLVVSHPRHPVLYVVDPTSRTVQTYSVDLKNGSLSTLGIALPAGVRGSDAVIDPSGNFLYIGDWNKGLIAGFFIDAGGGLTLLTGFPTVTPLLTQTQRGGGISLTIDSSGQFLYAASSEADQVAGFRIDRTSGALTPVPGSSAVTGDRPFRVVAAP